jgi:hypothetical protein
VENLFRESQEQRRIERCLDRVSNLSIFPQPVEIHNPVQTLGLESASGVLTMALTLLSTNFPLFRMYYCWFMRLMEDMCHFGSSDGDGA